MNDGSTSADLCFVYLTPGVSRGGAPSNAVTWMFFLQLLNHSVSCVCLELCVLLKSSGVEG